MALLRAHLSVPALLIFATLGGQACAQRDDSTTPNRSDSSGAATVACASTSSGLIVPAGFCATLFASDLSGPRQLTVGDDGTVYVATGDGVAALRDTTGDGQADLRTTFGPGGGNDVAIHGGALYYALRDRIVRWPLDSSGAPPSGDPETVASGLPVGGDHPAKSIAFSGDSMFVNFGSADNSCQEKNRSDRSPGRSPCTELDTRAGIWVFSASGTGQHASAGNHYATGLRNAEAIAVAPGTGQLWMAMNGRDQLSDNWGFSAEANAENPAEEFGPVEHGIDYGWPYCYYSTSEKAKVLAPEYGGNGTEVGRCANAAKPAIAFPAHWAPLALTFYDGSAFGSKYQGGAFIAFHGSWNRSPLPQAGYRVVFVPFSGGKPSGQYETFATGSAGDTSLRASGVAVAPDGALYISADANGKVWKVVRGS
ncbi:MAG TPA: PQQ-dependent sugar dehydrogenase [Gemmatimonadales bacterium]|nr:PQQ-dependent sugar dehydrogenase [Gemmatimonadales bacterium]